MNKEREQMLKFFNKMTAPIPYDIQWFIADCMPKYIIRKTLKKHSECFCPECNSSFMKDDCIGGKDAFCPVCGYKGKYKYIKYLHKDKVKVAVAEVMSDGNRAISYFNCSRTYGCDRNNYHIYADEYASIIFDDNNIYRYKIYRGGGYNYPDWHPLYYGYLFDKVFVYPSIQQIFPEYAHLAGNCLCLDAYIDNKDMSVYRPTVKNYKKFYNVSSNMKGVMKKLNLTYETYRHLQEMKVDTPYSATLEKYAELNHTNTENWSALLQYGSFNKLANYFIKQKDMYVENGYNHANEPYTNMHRLFSSIIMTYQDYIAIASTDGSDMTKKAVLFPRDLYREHKRQIDVRTQEEELRKKKELAKQNRNLIKTVRRLWKKSGTLYAAEGFAVLFPKTYEEFKYEGNMLNHCVARNPHYLENQLNKKASNKIFFIRKEKELNKPYITMEADISTGKIRQIYGFCDSSAPNEVRKFAETFLAYYMSTTFKAEKLRDLAKVV